MNLLILKRSQALAQPIEVKAKVQLKEEDQVDMALETN